MNVAYKHRLGFTLVELMVVIAIIGVLVGLIIPAIGMARESARTAACQNNLKQIGNAVVQHNAAMQSFPKNVCAGPSGGNPSLVGVSWMTGILPYLEQDSLYDQCNFVTVASPPTKVIDLFAASAVRSFPLDVFHCPSDPTKLFVEARGEAAWCDPVLVWGTTSYKGVAGSYWGAVTTTEWDDPSYPKYLKPIYRPDNSTYDYRFNANNGVFYAGVSWAGLPAEICATKLADIKDGATNTLMIGESIGLYSARSAWFHPVMSTATTFWKQNLEPQCQTTASQLNDYRTCFWDWEHNTGFISAHKSGCNYAMCDGSVKFIPDSIDLDVFQKLGCKSDGFAVSVP